MFITSEKAFVSFTFNTVVYCLGTGDALKHISFTASSDLPAGRRVIGIPYVMCGTNPRGNESLMTV